MTERNDGRSVVYLDTDSLHFLDLFMRYVQDGGVNLNEIESGALSEKLEQVDEIGYRKSLDKGRRIISFVLQQDAQVEFSYVSMVELLCGRVRGAVIENAAREGIPDRMWSRLTEQEIRDRSKEEDLARIRRRLGDLGTALEETGVVFGFGSEGRHVLDILELAASIVGRVYLSVTDSLVYAGAIAARAEILITGDGYLYHTVNLIHNPSGRARYEAIQRYLVGLTARSLPVARDCSRL